MLQNYKVTAFTVSELLRKNQQGRCKITQTTQIRVKFCFSDFNAVVGCILAIFQLMFLSNRNSLLFILYKKLQLKNFFGAASERCSINPFIKMNRLEIVLTIFKKYPLRCSFLIKLQALESSFIDFSRISPQYCEILFIE